LSLPFCLFPSVSFPPYLLLSHSLCLFHSVSVSLVLSLRLCTTVNATVPTVWR
jgi:hypothetical protein